jgi:CRP/FNR family transcriptional regulator, nitrogen oxide reductase regulator
MTALEAYDDALFLNNLLSGVPEQVHADIMANGKRIVLRPGQTLIRQGDDAKRCYLVLTGRLKLVKLHEQGKEAVIRYLGPGQVTAAIALLKQKEYPVTAQAIDAAEVLGFESGTINRLLLTHPQMALNMLRMLLDRLDDLQNRYLELRAEQVEQRIARSLLRLMQHSGRRTEQGVLIDFSLSRQELADYTATTLYTVSRTLSAWEKSGWVKSERERITITDPHALVELSERS